MEFGIFVVTCAFGGMFGYAMYWRSEAKRYERWYRQVVDGVRRIGIGNSESAPQDSATKRPT